MSETLKSADRGDKISLILHSAFVLVILAGGWPFLTRIPSAFVQMFFFMLGFFFILANLVGIYWTLLNIESKQQRRRYNRFD